jgi:uncharacterized membrane protein
VIIDVIVKIMTIIVMIVVLFLICYFPFITCVHCIENKILSKILSFIHTLLRCGKIINTHSYIHTITDLFQIFNKKNWEARKKKKNYDVSTTLLLAVAARANERASERGG